MRANFVGSSVVSAITHTPASGPFGPLTTPESSLAVERPANKAAPAAARRRSIFTLTPSGKIAWAMLLPIPGVRAVTYFRFGLNRRRPARGDPDFVFARTIDG